jgi:exopolysaccharide biosynthesis polyprenyl glycosylphosphotransferase
MLPHGRTLAALACAIAEILLLAGSGFAVLLVLLHDTQGAALLASCSASAVAAVVMIAGDACSLEDLTASSRLCPARGLAGLAGGLCCLAALELVQPAGSWRAALAWAAMAVLGLTVSRAAGAHLVRRQFERGALLFRVAVLGEGCGADDVRHGLLARRHAGITLCGPTMTDQVLGRWGSLEGFCRARRIDALVFTRGEIEAFAPDTRQIQAEILCLDECGVHTPCLGRHPLHQLKLALLQARVVSERAIITKAVFDVLLSTGILCAILPGLALIALAIKLTSHGPVFFRQPRIGYGGEVFQVLKFRTMYAEMTDMLAARQTERGDPRVTPIGRILRRLSIDELPQLINVLRGDMSLVGPRPHAPHTAVGGVLLHTAVSDYGLRHRVKPGITGWAQVNGARGALRTREQLQNRLDLDLDYIRRHSLLLDIRILLMTVFREIFSTSAY